MNKINSWLEKYDQIAKRQVAQTSLGQLINLEDLTLDLVSFHHLTGLTAAIFSFPENESLVLAGTSPQIATLKRICSADIIQELIKIDSSTPYQQPRYHAGEDMQLVIVPLAIAERCLAYLILGQSMSASLPPILADNSPLQLARRFLGENLQRRLLNAQRHFEQESLIPSLKEQAELFKAIFREAPYGITISRASDGEYFAVNPAFCELAGFSEEEILGHNPYQQIPQDAQASVHLEEMLRLKEVLLREGRVGPMELPLDSPKGIQYTVFNAKLLQLQGETCAISVTVNITAQKAVEKALREREAIFSAIFENSPLPIVITRMRDNCQVKASKAYYKISGYSEEDVQSGVLLQDLPEDYRREYQKLTERLIKEGRLENVETWFRRKGNKMGRVLFSSSIVELSGEPHVISISMDVDERYRMEQAIRTNEERYRLVADLTGQLHYDWDPATNSISWIGRCEQVLGYSKAEMDGWGVEGTLARIPAAESEALAKLVTASMNQSPTFLMEYRMQKADGSYAHMESEGAFLRDEQGQVCRILGVCKDVSRRKIAEQELTQRNDELMRFTYTVSHDLRSPLITIKSFLNMLEQDIEKKSYELMPKHFSFIHKAANKMTSLLDELLELSRVGRVVSPSEEMSLQEIVHDAVDLVHAQIVDKNVELVVTSQPIILYGERTRLIELFQNLLDNATKFFGEQPQPRIEIGAEQMGEDWSIFVRDNGLGIEPCYLEKIFGLFEKLNPQVEGSGIGLALVKRIVEIHHGKILAESEGLGRGTTFRFTLAGTKIKQDR